MSHKSLLIRAMSGAESEHHTPRDDVTLVVRVSPDELRGAIAGFVEYYDRRRYHKAL